MPFLVVIGFGVGVIGGCELRKAGAGDFTWAYLGPLKVQLVLLHTEQSLQPQGHFLKLFSTIIKTIQILLQCLIGG